MSAPKSQATKAARASSVSAFKKMKGGRPLELPSGLIMVCKRVELRSFLKQGDVPNPLMPIIDEALNKGKSLDVDKMIAGKDGKVDLDMVDEMYNMVDNVICSISIEPKVHPVPEDEDDRDDELLYTDEVDDEDKMFLFQWSIGGTSDLERFRQEAAADLATLAQGSGGKSPAKRASGSRAR